MRMLAPIVGALVALSAQPAHPSMLHHTPAAAHRSSSAARVPGFYNLMIFGPRGSTTADLIIQESQKGYKGFMLKGDHSTEVMDIRLEGETLSGVVMTSEGRAELTVRITETGMSGTLRLEKVSLSIVGERAI